MTRINFFKSLLTLVTAPAVIKEIDFVEPVKEIEVLATNTFMANWGIFIPKSTTGNLFKDMNDLAPEMYEQHRKKYEDYGETVKELNK